MFVLHYLMLAFTPIIQSFAWILIIRFLYNHIRSIVHNVI